MMTSACRKSILYRRQLGTSRLNDGRLPNSISYSDQLLLGAGTMVHCVSLNGSLYVDGGDDITS